MGEAVAPTSAFERMTIPDAGAFKAAVSLLASRPTL
jgi:hypothetical protein